jgi:hypothetical protein
VLLGNNEEGADLIKAGLTQALGERDWTGPGGDGASAGTAADSAVWTNSFVSRFKKRLMHRFPRQARDKHRGNTQKASGACFYCVQGIDSHCKMVDRITTKAMEVRKTTFFEPLLYLKRKLINFTKTGSGQA